MALQALLVDDDPELRDILQTFFARHGVGLTCLPDGACLLTHLQRERPSVIVMDMMMPKLDGLTALKRLRARGDTTPVIMLTTYAGEVERLLDLELGADDIVQKPFSPRDLLHRIDILARRDAKSAANQPAMPSVPVTPVPCRLGAFAADLTPDCDRDVPLA